MSAKQPTIKVGDLIKVKKTVTRPNGEEVAVTGGLFVVDEPGTFLVDGDEMEAKEK